MIGTWLGQPKGIYLIAFTELWERFSYFGMAALLALFLSAATASGGWGWSRADAVLFYSFYAGLVFVMPVLGGWIANNYLGERRAIVIGGVLLTVGHMALAMASFVPSIIGWMTAVDGQAVIARSEVLLGRLWSLDEVSTTLAATAEQLATAPEQSARLYRAALWTYIGNSGCFLAGLLCILVAIGLFKSSIAAIVGKLYPARDARRDAGYALFFSCIYIGAMLANLGAGGLGESAGWQYGFGAAAAGMSIGILTYLWNHKEYLGDVGVLPDLARSEADSRAPPLTPVERDRVRVAVLQSMFATLYAGAYYQKGGVLNLYTRDHVDRTLFGMEVPATWFLSISILVFVLVTPLLTTTYLRWERQGRNPSASYKLAAALLLIGVAYAIVGHAEMSRLAGGRLHIDALWLVGAYILFGVADALVWPNQMALLTKLAPRRYATLAVGVWHLTTGLGIWLAGLIGIAVDRAGELQLFVGLALLCLVAGAVVVQIAPTLSRMMHGAEHVVANRGVND